MALIRTSQIIFNTTRKYTTLIKFEVIGVNSFKNKINTVIDEEDIYSHYLAWGTYDNTNKLSKVTILDNKTLKLDDYETLKSEEHAIDKYR
ncbi:MAG: hypothetical protein CMF62_02005 [Magnetococcales bacterium]|nr:hypothetical protein [Magnetococcales bacterium]|tara:strand:+ start:135586 stop:135858 length:273 start_codon:yes stop_codon:yes gene_type:complete